MKVKKCRKCGKENPPFFTHCVDCGTILAAEPAKALKIPAYLKTALIIGVFLLLLILVIPPLVQYALSFGRFFSETTVTPVEGNQMNQMVENNNLQITINSAHDGVAFQNSYKFFIVTAYLKNVKTSSTIQISNNDFEVIDNESRSYIPYGIGSKTTYEFYPSQGGTVELNFIIPQTVAVKKIRFTFPTKAGTTNPRNVVEFDV